MLVTSCQQRHMAGGEGQGITNDLASTGLGCKHGQDSSPTAHI